MEKEKLTQEQRVLNALIEANGEWVNGRYFLHTLHLSQFHTRIHTLQNEKYRYGYDGVIEASEFRDEYNFKSYRLRRVPVQERMLI